MKSGHSVWTKYRQKREVVDLQGIFNDYWASKKHKFTVPSQSWSLTSPLISDREVQRSLSLESIVGLLKYNSLQTLLFVPLKLSIPIG